MPASPVPVSGCVLGVDASLSCTAFAALTADGTQYHWSITTNGAWPLARRLRVLADAAYRIASSLHPALVVVEEPGFVVAAHGVGPITALGRAQGAIIAGLPTGTEIETIIVSRLRSVMALHVPRGKGEAKRATLAYVEQRGITVPRLGNGEHDDDIADAYMLALYGRTRLQGAPRGGTVPPVRRERRR